MTGWVFPDDVYAELGGGPFSEMEQRQAQLAIVAADRLVCRWRPDLTPGSDPAVVLGAAKLAASMFRKRGASGADFAEFADMATPAMPGVIDAEIQALLGIGRHHDPVVA